MKNYHTYKNQVVRDLAWAVASLPLIKNFSDSDYTFLSAKYFEEEYFSRNTYPLLIAELDLNDNGIYEEISRGFVVSDYWPNLEL